MAGLPALEPLPPFDYPDESIEQAAEMVLDHASQLKLLTKRVSQIAERQDAEHRNNVRVMDAVDRVLDGQTVVNGVLSLMIRRQRRQMEADGIADDLEEKEIEERLLGRMR